jgi:glutamyl-tRNA reductase
VSLVTDNVDNLTTQKILFIGAGQMMNQIAPHFLNIKFNQKTIVNRTLENAVQLANRVEANVLPLINLPDIVSEYSIIIACCSISHPILNVNMFSREIVENKPILIIDLSMPLLTDLELRRHPNIKILTIDDIAKIVDVGVEKRKIAAFEADSLINSKLIEYQNWLKKRDLSPVIKQLRDNAEEIRLDVLTIAQKQLQNGELADEVLRSLSVKLTNKLLHNPTVNLCAAENNLQTNVTELVHYLYDLK